MATIISPAVATLEDLARVEGKAELVDGKIVLLMATGAAPGYAGDEIFASLREYARRTGLGRAVSDNKAFVVNLPHRRTFSPDAAYFTGPSGGLGFYQGSPDFAVEVRSENDYGASAEESMRAKRSDYFAAGTQVVWDVDLLGGEWIVGKFTAATGASVPAATFGRGTMADADPAVPGWTLLVDDLFEPE